ncbi:MAG: YkvA family protein [Candidatus Cyclobacteriaceae bacterium M2_1C_046]
MAKKKTTTRTRKKTAPDKNKLIHSRAFQLAMNIAKKYAYSRSRLFVLISQAFEKLKDEAASNKLKKEFTPKLRLFLRMLRAYASGQYREIPINTIIKIAGAVVYFVMVVDFIPDFIPILGFTDDLAVIIWVYNSIDDQMNKFKEWESSVAKAGK